MLRYFQNNPLGKHRLVSGPPFRRQTPAGVKPVGNADGVALVMVLWVIVILTVIVGEFSAVARSQLLLAGNFKEKTQAHYLAVSGLEQALYAMATDRDFFSFHQPLTADTPADVHRWRVNGDNPLFQYGAGLFKVRIDNMAGKVNINRADRRLLRIIVDGLDIDAQQKDVIVDAIMDWRDVDSAHRINGAEDDYYRDLGTDYLCKDGDFDTVDELRLVRGVTPELFDKLEPVFCVYPKNDDPTLLKSVVKKTAGADTDWNRINVNAATPEMWARLPGMTADDIDAVIDYRRDADFRSLSELAPVISADAYSRVRPYLTLTSSPWFLISAVGATDGSRLVAGLTATVVKADVSGQTGDGFHIVEQRSSANGRLVARFRHQREVLESVH